MYPNSIAQRRCRMSVPSSLASVDQVDNAPANPVPTAAITRGEASLTAARTTHAAMLAMKVPT